MRILLTTGIFPPDIGGPATYLPLAAAGLAAIGHRTSVLTTREGAQGFSATFPFDVHAVARRPPLRRTLTFALATGRLAAGADVVFANGMHFESLLGATAARRPTVLKIVGDAAWERSVRLGWTTKSFEAFQKSRSGSASAVLRMQLTIVARCARHVIVPSRYLGAVVQGWGVPETQISVVYNAVPTPSATCTAVGGAGALRVATVGRLVPWKGIDLLIESLAQVENLHLTVVGDGPEEPVLRELAVRCGVSPRVTFKGRMSQQALRVLLRTHDVFALASSYEGLPHVLLEAMGEGLPVVATAAGGIPEVVVPGETGMLIEPTPGSVAEAFSALQRDRDLVAEMGRRARNRILEHFTVDAMLQATERVLLSVVANADTLRAREASPVVERSVRVGGG